jgi:hypothetical protein
VCLRGFKRNIFVDSLYLMLLLILKHKLLIVKDYFLLPNLLKAVFNASISTNLALKYYIKTRNAPGISIIAYLNLENKNKVIIDIINYI